MAYRHKTLIITREINIMANKLDGFRPIGDLILIKRDESLKMTKGGLYLPEQSQEQLCTGYVVWAGEA